MKIKYENKRFQPESLRLIGIADSICTEYDKQGLNLTLRQLYYQFVARDIIENNLHSYKRLQKLISNARLAGLIDWSAIVDRTRNLQTHPSWYNPRSIIQSAAESFRVDPWDDQEYLVQAWVEKDALLGVMERAVASYRLPYFSCRGYVSQSEIHDAALRLKQEDREVIILHLGDHDPSGVDMTRDMQDRFTKFGATNVTFRRIALTMEQVQELNPPPNPTKITDSRAKGYISEFGHESWELDALTPNYIVDLVDEKALDFVDLNAWEISLAEEETHRANLAKLSDNYGGVVNYINSI